MMLAAITRLGYLTYGSDGPFPEDLPTTVMFHSYVELREGPMTFHKSLSGFSKQNPSFFWMNSMTLLTTMLLVYPHPPIPSHLWWEQPREIPNNLFWKGSADAQKIIKSSAFLTLI